MRRIIIGIFAVLALPAALLLFNPAAPTVSAANTGTASAARCSTSFLGLPTWFRYLEFNSECEIIGPNDPATGKLDWQAAAGRVGLAVIEILTRLAALVAVGFVMYGGFRYITSQGDPESAKSARQTIINSLIGLVISLIATGVVAFIANSLTS